MRRATLTCEDDCHCDRDTNRIVHIADQGTYEGASEEQWNERGVGEGLKMGSGDGVRRSVSTENGRRNRKGRR